MSALLSTLIGGLLALAGASIGPFLQRKHDRWLAGRADRQNLRDKAQELFDEIDRMQTESGKASARAAERVSNEALEPRTVPELGRARALSALYFPDCLPHLEKFERESAELTATTASIVQDALAAPASGGSLKALPAIMVIKRQQIASSFADAMRSELIRAVANSLRPY